MFYRNKIRSFTKTRNFSNLFLSILFILTFLLVLFNKTDYFIVNKIKSFSIDVITPAVGIINFPIKVTANAVKTINEIRFLQHENLKLKEEVIRLKKWQTLAFKNQRENKAYRKLLDSTITKINIIKTASVISQSSKIYAKTILINAGLNHGVSVNMSVINERGLIGKIISLTNKNSKVILINDQNLSVPVKTISNKLFAIIKGSADGKYLTSSFIKDDKKPKIGDLLLTSGNTKTFPKDILVGKVIKVNEDNFLALPYVDFDNIDFVQVIDVN